MKFSFKLISIFVISMFLLAGCANQKPAENKIVIWHWMNDRKEALDTLAQEYNKIAGVEVEFKLFSPPDIYAQKVIAAARAGRLPDVFGILGEKKTIASFIKAGYILNLSPYMDKDGWGQSFYSQALRVTDFKKNNKYDIAEGSYAVPIDLTVMEFLYSKDLFVEAGLDPERPPATFDEFIAYAKQIKETTGNDGFVCGWGEGWLLNALATEWAINIMGRTKFYKTMAGEVPYTDPDWVEVFGLFKQMKDADILTSDITTMINKESEDFFSKGKAGFSFNGSWAVNVYKQLSGNSNYKFFPLPKAGNYPIMIWGGAGTSFMINARSQKKEKVVEFLKWLTAAKQQEYLAVETNNLPSIKGVENVLSETLGDLIQDVGILTHPNIWPDNEDSRVLEVMNKGLQQIVMGIKSPKELATEIQKVKERVLKQ